MNDKTAELAITQEARNHSEAERKWREELFEQEKQAEDDYYKNLNEQENGRTIPIEKPVGPQIEHTIIGDDTIAKDGVAKPSGKEQTGSGSETGQPATAKTGNGNNDKEDVAEKQAAKKKKLKAIFEKAKSNVAVEDTATLTTPISEDAHNKVAGAVEKTLGKPVDVLHGKDFDDAAAKATGVDVYRKRNGTIYGFVHDGKITLNGDTMNAHTPLHEGSHLFTDWLKQHNPEMHRAGLDIMDGTNYLDVVKKNKFYQDEAARMRKAGATAAEIEDFYREEALAHAVGDAGAKMVNKYQKTTFAQWLGKFWDAVKGIGGKAFEKLTADDVSKMSWKQFADGMAKRMLEGKRLEGDTDNKGNAKLHIAGEKAKLDEDVRNNLETARDMEHAHDDPHKIYLATGWERGADGKWRHELPDISLDTDKMANSGDVTLADVATGNKALFKAYPELKDTQLVAVPNLDANGSYSHHDTYYNDNTGRYEENKHIIKYDARLLDDPEKLKSVITHEIQHGIQQVEGFAMGGSIDGMAKIGENNIGIDGHATYQKLAGEAEARNAETRLQMGEKERMATPFSHTEDVAREDQIKYFGGGKNNAEKGRQDDEKSAENILKQPLKDVY